MSENGVRESAAIEATPSLPAGRAEHVGRRERSRRNAYRLRFAAIYFALAAVLGAAVGSFVVLAAQDDPAPAAQWSEWEPDGSSTARIRQIADHITRGYRQNGDQLAFAIGSRPQVNVPGQGELDVGAIVVQPDTSTGQREEGDYDGPYDGDAAVAYRLCGDGQACSIASGSPSQERLQLLRREALELSLYTFKYVKGADSVVVFLPPPPPDANGEQSSSGALFLRRGDVSDQLRVPLSRTLAATTPGAGQMSAHEASRVDRLTRPNVYGYTYQQTADGNVFLILSPSTGA
jgi:hypothetical protein